MASSPAPIVKADEGGFGSALPQSRETLRKGQAMSAWIEKSLPLVVREYLGLRASGETASH